MFKSELSGKCYGEYTSPVRVVVERRPKSYQNKDGKLSRGWEIVREIAVGPDEVEAALARAVPMKELAPLETTPFNGPIITR